MKSFLKIEREEKRERERERERNRQTGGLKEGE